MWYGQGPGCGMGEDQLLLSDILKLPAGYIYIGSYNFAMARKGRVKYILCCKLKCRGK